MKFKVLIVLFTLFFVGGCASWSRTFFAKDLVNVNLGEEKSAVVKKLGGVATPVAAQTHEGHLFEILEFAEKPFYAGRPNKAYWTRYWVYFMDNKMVKYEKAYAADAIEHDKWMADVMAMASTMEAFKGTAVMPYQINQSVQHSGQVNVDANVSGTIKIKN